MTEVIGISSNGDAVQFVADANSVSQDTVKQASVLFPSQILGIEAAMQAFIATTFAAEAEANAGIHSTPPTITTSAQVDTLMATVPRSY